ncbi:MAG: hypothetical protein ABIN89_06830 [Chitinophagaceae bacterium]
MLRFNGKEFVVNDTNELPAATRSELLTKRIIMEQKAYELFIKYINIHSLMSKNAAKTCAYFELEGRVEEFIKLQLPGDEFRIKEMEEMKIQVMNL